MTIKIALTNLGLYNEGELNYTWVTLPASEDELQQAMDQIGINDQYEEFFISDYETDIEGLRIGEYDNLDQLNELAERFETLDKYEVDKLQALIEYDSFYLKDLDDTLDKLDDVHLYYDINTDEELGYYVVDEGLFGVEIPEALQNYIDHEAIGRDWRINASGGFTSMGFLEIL